MSRNAKNKILNSIVRYSHILKITKNDLHLMNGQYKNKHLIKSV